MTPEKWIEQFESETIVSRQLAVATGYRCYDDPCNGELKKGRQYILLIDDAGDIWLEDRPEHGVFPSAWFKVLEDLPLEPKEWKPKEWKPKIGDTAICNDPTGLEHRLVKGFFYRIDAVKDGCIRIDSRWHKQSRFVSIIENIALPGTAEPGQAMIRADKYNPVGEARRPSERERAWEQQQKQKKNIAAAKRTHFAANG